MTDLILEEQLAFSHGTEILIFLDPNIRMNIKTDSDRIEFWLKFLFCGR